MMTASWELLHYCKATWIVRDLPSNYYKTILTDFLASEFVMVAYNITILCAMSYPAKGVMSILGHQHTSAHKITFNLLKKEK